MRAQLGAFPEAEEALRRALVSAERMGLATVAALARHNLGGVLAALGRLEEARAAEEHAIVSLSPELFLRRQGRTVSTRAK